MFVYIAACANVDFIKIGISNNPQRRLTELQSHSPYAVEIVYLVNCADASTAQQLEGLLHALMSTSRSNGEWFHASSETAIRFALSILSVSGKISAVSTNNEPTNPITHDSKFAITTRYFEIHPEESSKSIRDIASKLGVGKDTVNAARNEFLGGQTLQSNVMAWFKSDPRRLLLSSRESQRLLRQDGIITSHVTINKIRRKLTVNGKGL